MEQPASGHTLIIPAITTDTVVNICLDTIKIDRQGIVFLNTKRSAESQAEKIAAKCTTNPSLQELSKKILHALPSPTRQCKRLAHCVSKGVAFHHAGLESSQRSAIEHAFRDRVLKIICATPTLAAGLDMPAFRVIIRDLKRYGGPWGLTDIPVLEFEQQAGRAGRPGKNPWGEAITIAKDDEHAQAIIEHYIKGDPEDIFSKLAVEPILRMHVLSLIATEYVRTSKSLLEFFDSTFYAHQYADTDKLHRIISKVLAQLSDWGFLEHEEFKSANDDSLKATLLGKRTSELYIDPYTAHHIIVGLERAKIHHTDHFSLLHLLCSTLEMRPYVRVKAAELDSITARLEKESLIHLPPSAYSEEFDEFLDTVKTAMLFNAWTEEVSEDQLLEDFGMTPGELHVKLATLDWVCYAALEFTRLRGDTKIRSQLAKLRVRLKNGVREDALELLRLREIGRVRARKLIRSGIADVAAVRAADVSVLGKLVGNAVAKSLKKQLGIEVDVPADNKKGQFSLSDYQ
jgi:helicase